VLADRSEVRAARMHRRRLLGASQSEPSMVAGMTQRQAAGTPLSRDALVAREANPGAAVEDAGNAMTGPELDNRTAILSPARCSPS